jgi:hypothetical protein
MTCGSCGGIVDTTVWGDYGVTIRPGDGVGAGGGGIVLPDIGYGRRLRLCVRLRLRTIFSRLMS